MKLYSFYNKDFVNLKKRFVSTIKDEDIHLNIVCVDLNTHNKACGGEEVWLFKTKDIVNRIKENMGQIILYTDIDIQFFRPIKEIVNKAIAENDIVFQRNPLPAEGTLNIGFMAIRCNDKTLSFWQKVFDIVVQEGIHDQLVIQRLLNTNTDKDQNKEYKFKGTAPLRFDVFPLTFWAYHGENDGWNRDMPKDLVLHHATWAYKEEDKLQQMDKIQDLVGDKHHATGSLGYIGKIGVLLKKHCRWLYCLLAGEKNKAKTINDYKQVLDEIRQFEVSKIKDDQLINSICKFGLAYDPRDVYGEFNNCMNKEGELGLWQRPRQLAKCIKYLINNCTIKSFLEIGTYKASTFLILREYLLLKNHSLDSMTIDPMKFISDELVNSFDINYQKKRIEDIKKNYDLIFIDGDHSYKGVKNDYEYALKLNPKYILFHDVIDKNCPDVVRFWSEIKNDLENYKEFKDCDDLMGFGLIILQTENEKV